MNEMVEKRQQVRTQVFIDRQLTTVNRQLIY